MAFLKMGGSFPVVDDQRKATEFKLDLKKKKDIRRQRSSGEEIIVQIKRTRKLKLRVRKSEL